MGLWRYFPLAASWEPRFGWWVHHVLSTTRRSHCGPSAYLIWILRGPADNAWVRSLYERVWVWALSSLAYQLLHLILSSIRILLQKRGNLCFLLSAASSVSLVRSLPELRYVSLVAHSSQLTYFWPFHWTRLVLVCYYLATSSSIQRFQSGERSPGFARPQSASNLDHGWQQACSRYFSPLKRTWLYRGSLRSWTLLEKRKRSW